MRDLGSINHASVRLAVDGREWRVDSSLLSNVPPLLDHAVFIQDDPVFVVELEFEETSYVVWGHTPPSSQYLPRRLILGSITHPNYLARCEESRAGSPFDQRL